MEGIVSSDWLEEHLADPSLRLLDMRGSFASYEEQHIPGAQFLHIETLRMSEHGVPCKMHQLPVLAAIFGQLGIAIDTPVILYATRPFDHLSATYAAWSLAVTGNQHARILDGHLQEWEDEGLPLIQQYPRVASADYAAQFDPSIFASCDYVRDRLHDPEVVLVDSRTPSLYSGATGPTMRLGHIPGALLHNYVWDFTRDGRYRSVDQLRRRYEAKGIVPEKEIITYCITGREGSAVWFVLQKLLGYPRVRLYQGSLTEWSAHPELPMVIGDTPEGVRPASMRKAA